MASLLFAPYSAYGHVHPILPVIAELVARGHRVRVVVNGRFAARVTEAGGEPVCPAHEHEVRVPPRWGAVEGARWLAMRAARSRGWRETAELTRRELRCDPPDVLVVDPLARWSHRIARKSGTSTAVFCTTHTGGMRSPGALRWADRILVNALPELQPSSADLDHRYLLVGPLVATAAGEVPAGQREATPTDAELPWAAIRSGPTLLVAPGTVFARTPAFFTAVAGAFADTAWTVLLSTGSVPPSALGVLPPNVIARSWLPQLAVMPHATVLLTHAGMNSVNEALVSGVPMLLAPRSREQRGTAHRLTALGLGELAGVALARPAALRAAVGRLVDDERVRRLVAATRLRLSGTRAAASAADALLTLAG